MVRVKKMKWFDIYSNMNGGYIVYNRKKEFQDGHTHINNYNTAKYVAYLALYKKMPKNNHLSLYLTQSLIRLSDDTKYTMKLNELMNSMEEKKNTKTI